MADYVSITDLRSKRRPRSGDDGQLLSALTVAARAGEDNFAASGPMRHRQGETIRAFGARIAEAGGLTRGAATLIAANIVAPTDAYLRDQYAGRLIESAHQIEQWEQSRFYADPSPVRGKLSLCHSRHDLERIRPSLAVNVGVLRSLRFQASLPARCIALFWFLTAFEICGNSLMRIGDLAGLVGATPAQCRADLRRLSDSRFSLVDDPSIRKAEWIPDAGCVEIQLEKSRVSWHVAPSLLSLIKPRKDGPRFAHIELLTLLYLNQKTQENMYRLLLAVAAESKTWWAGGGLCKWTMSRNDAGQFFSTPVANVKHWRRYRYAPLELVLTTAGSRIKLISLSLHRKETSQGRSADLIIIDFGVDAASDVERPHSGKALARTLEREQSNSRECASYDGLGRVDLQTTALRHREAVRSYRLRRRKQGTKLASDSTDCVQKDMIKGSLSLEESDQVFLAFLDDAPTRSEKSEEEYLMRQVGVEATNSLLLSVPSDVLVAMLADLKRDEEEARMVEAKRRREVRIYDQLQIDGLTNDDLEEIGLEAENCFWEMHFNLQLQEEAIKTAQVGDAHRRYRDRGTTFRF